MRRAAFAASAFLLVLMLPTITRAQQPSAISEATRLRDAHQFAAAAHALDAYLASNPADAGTHWFQAQLLYWAGQNDAASRAYERALALTPADDRLRIDFARFLVATGRITRAQSVIAGIANGSGTSEVEQLRQQILHATSRWARLAADGSADNQSLHTKAANIEAGLYATPSLALYIAAALQRFSADSATAGANNVGSLTAAAAWSPEGRRFSARAAAGVERTTEVRSDRIAVMKPVGAISLALRAFSQTQLRATYDVHIYHHTLASIDSAFGVRAIELVLDRSAAQRVAALAAVRTESYPGGTTARTAYAWVLAPVISGVRIGASAAYQDADHSRWNGARYSPYYTPENVRSASALGELKFSGASRSLQLNGSYGFYAREDAPVSPQPATVFVERKFAPWTVAATGNVQLNPRASLSLHAQHQATAFYDVTQGSVSLLWRAH